MNKENLQSLIIVLVITVMVGSFSIIGLWLLSQSSDCTQPTIGTITDVLKEKTKVSQHKSRMKRTVEVDRPVIKYEVDGKTYESPANTADNVSDFAVGQNINILYNPSNPEEYILDNNPVNKVVIYCMIIIPAVIVFALWFFTIKGWLAKRNA